MVAFTVRSPATAIAMIDRSGTNPSRAGIEVSSVVGRGTAFELHLPAPRVDEWEAMEDIAFVDGEGRRILLVDGDATRLSLLGNALAAQGYDPVMAPDGAIALQQLPEAAVGLDQIIKAAFDQHIDGDAIRLRPALAGLPHQL